MIHSILFAPIFSRCSQNGAGDGIRTRDIQRGRLTLYQLSYTRATALLSPLHTSETRLVGREGFEPSKAGGRQVYSLLRLTASLPPQNTHENEPRLAEPDGWSWRRELNPRPAVYKTAALPLSYASDGTTEDSKNRSAPGTTGRLRWCDDAPATLVSVESSPSPTGQRRDPRLDPRRGQFPRTRHRSE